MASDDQASENHVMNQNTEWQDRLPNPETQTPPARSRWHAEWIPAIPDNQIQRLREEL